MPEASNIIVENFLSNDSDEPFFILDLEDVRKKFESWSEKMPRVVPFYAVKCNDDERVLKLLRDLGAGFDCASKKEILQILDMKVDPNRIIYANTAKQVSHLKLAVDQGIDKMTFDCPEELEKIKEFHPNAKVVLRIRFDALNPIFKLGMKFGCNPDTEAPKLIKLCKDMEMDLIGIAFHVGSGTTEYSVYEHALDAVRKLFDYAETIGMKLNFVDIGGGFIGKDLSLLENYASAINAGIEKNFPSNDVQIIAEPGRYFVDSAFSIVTKIILKRFSDDGQVYYYLNESIYMSFIVSFILKEKLEFSIVRKSKSNIESKKLLSTVWGCSCSALDKIVGDVLMEELETGDVLIFHNMGAYTTTVSTKFNGFSNLNIYTIDDVKNI